MFLGYIIGALSVIVFSLAWDGVVMLKRRYRLRKKYMGKPRFNIANYVEMSKHNDQVAVDRLFRLKRRW